MNVLEYIRSVRARFFHRSLIADVKESELSSHFQHGVDDLEGSGLDRAGAERSARVEFGGYQKFREQSQEDMSGSFFGTFAYMSGSPCAACISLLAL